MAVNVFRKNPASFGFIIKGIKKEFTDEFGKDNELVDRISEILKSRQFNLQ